MAGTITTDLAVITGADSTSDGGTWTKYVVSLAPVIEGDAKIHNTNCIAMKLGSNTVTAGAYIPLTSTFNVSGGEHIFHWRNYTTASNMKTKANQGTTFVITDLTHASSSAMPTDYLQWFLDGSDTDILGGWKCYVVDPNTVPSGTIGTSVNPGNIDLTAIKSLMFLHNQLTGLGVVTIANAFVDVVRAGKGLTVNDGTGSAPVALTDIFTYDSNNARAWGIVTFASSIYYGAGKINIGSATQTNLTVFRDSNQVFVWRNYPVAASFYQIIVVGKSTGPVYTNFILGSYNGTTGLASGGVTIKGAGDSSGSTHAVWTMTASDNYQVTKLYGSTFSELDSAAFTYLGSDVSASLSTTTNGTTTLTTSGNYDTSGIVPGMLVAGTGIPASTYVSSIASTTSLTLTQAATDSTTGSRTFSHNNEIRYCTFNNFADITTGGILIDNCTFQNVKTGAPISGTYALIVASSTEMGRITNCKFINCNRAIKITAAGDYTFTGNTFSGNTYDIENTASGANVADIYSESNSDGTIALNDTVIGVSQSFTGDGNKLANAVFYLSKTNTPTGSAYAKVYAHTGTFASSSLPTGTTLATSQAVNVANLTGSLALTTFYFADQDQNITLTNGTKYVVTIEYSAGTSSNTVNVGRDASSASAAGSCATLTGTTWTSTATTTDACFYVRTGGVVTVTLASGSNPSSNKVINSAAIPGVTTINTGVNVTVHVQDTNQAAVVGASVQVFQTSAPTNIIVNTTTNGSGDAVASTILSTGTALTIRVRLSPSGATRYLPAETSTTVPAANATITVILTTDSLIAATTSGTIASDFTINTTTKAIKHTSGTTVYTVNALYTWLMDYFDESGLMDDTIPMSVQTPSEYTLTNGWFLDNTSTQYLTQGAIQTSGWNTVIYVLTMSGTPTNPVAGDIGKTVKNTGTTHTGVLLDYTTTSPYKWYVRATLSVFTAEAVTIDTGTGAGTIASVATGEAIWSNIFTLGTLVSGTTMDVYQNDTQITPWWSSGQIDILVKVKEAGVETDSGNLIVLARKYSTLYDHFTIDASTGRNPVPLAAFTDGNNETAEGTVSGYTGITFSFGAKSRDLGNGNGFQPYDVEINCGGRVLTQVYEYLKYVTRSGSSTTLNGVNGEFYVAVGDIRLNYTGEASGPFVETSAITSSAGGSGYIVSLIDNGATGTLVIRNVHGIFADTNTLTSGATTATISGTPDTISPPKQAPFGTFAGGKFFGTRGVFITNMHANDANKYVLIDSINITQTPPATVPVAVGGLVSGDRVSVFRTTGDNEIIDKTYLLSHASANTSGSTTFTATAAIPADTPTSGVIRVVDNTTNTEQRYSYTSFSGSVFSGIVKLFSPNTAGLDRNYITGDTAYVPYIDEQATGTSVSKSVTYVSDRFVLTRVRLKGIQPFTTKGSLINIGYSATAVRTTDSIA